MSEGNHNPFYGPQSSGGDRKPFKIYRLKPWNPSPKNPIAKMNHTPGIILETRTKEGDKWVSDKELRNGPIDAVVLLASPARSLKGSLGRVKCASHDGHVPSPSVDEPLCRKATSSDIVNIISKYKGYDAAKIQAVEQELTLGTGKLQFCGIKTDDGSIPICPFARKNPDTGKAGDCQRQLVLYIYIPLKGETFVAELSGKHIRADEKYTAPIHGLFKYCAAHGVPCYGVKVRLSAVEDGAYYSMGVEILGNIEDGEELQRMEELAHRALERHKKKNQKREESERAATVAAQETASPLQSVMPRPQAAAANPFDDDDIPF